MNSREAAKALNVGVATVTRWLKEGKIRGTISISGRISISESEIERLKKDNLQKQNCYKMFEKTYHGEKSSFEVFEIWAKASNIVKFLESQPQWQKVTKNGLRGLRDPYSDRVPATSHIFDHTSLWIDANGKKVLVSQPYQYIPFDYNSCFSTPNAHYKLMESEKDSLEYMADLVKWAEERNLKVDFLPSRFSWYYPGSTILIEIREKESVSE